jgi:hypothetical protein
VTFFTTLPVARLYSAEWYAHWWTNWKGFGRKQLWPNRGTISSTALRGWGKPRKLPVSIAGVPFEIRTEHLRIRVSERYHYAKPVSAVMSFVYVESNLGHCELTDSHLTWLLLVSVRTRQPDCTHAVARSTSFLIPLTCTSHLMTKSNAGNWMNKKEAP